MEENSIERNKWLKKKKNTQNKTKLQSTKPHRYTEHRNRHSQITKSQTHKHIPGCVTVTDGWIYQRGLKTEIYILKQRKQHAKMLSSRKTDTDTEQVFSAVELTSGLCCPVTYTVWKINSFFNR